MDVSSTTFAPLIILAAILGFALFWTGVVTLVGWISGWRRLANDFETLQEPSGNTFRWQSIRFGFRGNYKRVINITPTFEGLHLQPILIYRMGHKPLLIPWEYIHLEEKKQVAFINYISAEIIPKHGGSPTNITFYRKNVIESLQQYAT